MVSGSSGDRWWRRTWIIFSVYITITTRRNGAMHQPTIHTHTHPIYILYVCTWNTHKYCIHVPNGLRNAWKMRDSWCRKYDGNKGKRGGGGERLRGKMEKVLQLQDDFTLQSLWSINKKKLFKYWHVHGKGIDYKYMYKYILEFKTRHEYY